MEFAAGSGDPALRMLFGGASDGCKAVLNFPGGVLAMRSCLCYTVSEFVQMLHWNMEEYI